MAPFPSPLERTVASALLLLSNRPTTPSPPESRFDAELVGEETGSNSSDDQSMSLASAESKPSVSALDASREILDHQLRIITVAARCHEMNLKVVRRSRSKLCLSDDGEKAAKKPLNKASSRSDTTEVSCLSSSSNARSRCVGNVEKSCAKALEELKKKHGGGSAQMLRRAEAILKLLSDSGSSEMKIRQVLGDSPDTSKALRMLLKLEEIKRSGTGGRQDPYIYTIA
ncbi:uncharacterized protein LOC110811225 [Carica papaya]|uniref:uncharacterized protein LOC110811225 n=1 Tax=Carica papaya TaxID=3649 RepID=UPI000B8CCD34|nr:uncharacterized protein LOC110811225 [Carica papaya]